MSGDRTHWEGCWREHPSCAIAIVGLLREKLVFAKEKIEKYRAAHGGEYVGGVEYSNLMKQIDAALALVGDR